MNIFDKQLLSNADRRQDFSAITIGLASPEKIRSWSFGEVRLPETINYRTFKPEQGGLFCAQIFGPIKDYACLCGKYKRVKKHDMVCDKCGVEIVASKVRRERMGHINLACPVAHILFFKSLPSRIGLMLNLTMRDIERILYFEAYVVLDPKRLPDIERGQMMTPDDYQNLRASHGPSSFVAGSGAEGLRDFLKGIDLDDEIDSLRAEMKRTSSTAKRKKILRHLKLVENFRDAKQRPEWMILDALPVLPPGLRPLVALEGGRMTTSDLNELYRRVINRNNRLRRLIDLDAPEIIINNEKRMLQEVVDSLLDNGRRGKPAVATNSKRPLKSLADTVKGKAGRFRQNLLGKRVDFSARSVIVVGPNLKLHQCGLPKYMALNLFRPFVFNQLIKQGFVDNIRQARQKVETPDADVWDVLEKVIRQHPILLNRAPTLHRLGIQAFEPVLIEGKSIQLHPLVCVAFNADFDGDQMAVHVPLSLEAQAEARVLMLSSNNILAPANGEPIILPTQDIVLGIYYATRERAETTKKRPSFVDVREMEAALAVGGVDAQTKINVLLPTKRVFPAHENAGESEERMMVETTPGRVLMSYFLPAKVPFSAVNRTLKKRDLVELVNQIFRNCGLRETVIFCDKLMRFGFEQATRAGISICMDDMMIASRKAEIIRFAEEKMQQTQQQFRNGLLTQDECYNESIDLWDKAGEEVSRLMMDELSREEVIDPASGKAMTANGKSLTQESFNSLYMMADSGARGSPTQIKQLAGMRGLMTKPDGRIMETAITANFREGLSVLQYFLSTHGARKGLADTALKTANSGYLTRRLVDVAQDVIVVEEDCGADDGIVLRAVLTGGDVLVPLKQRVLGRVLATDVLHPQSSQVIYPAGTFINEKEAEEIEQEGVDEVVVRSPVKCRLSHGLCVKCYGRDLARGRTVQLGEAVGVIAAQSIGEPGTQLTMRTFHIGGAASRAVVARSTEAKTDGVINVINARVIKNSRGGYVVVSRGGEVSVKDASGRERERYRLQYGEMLNFKDGDKIKAGALISTRDPMVQPIVTEYGGIVRIDGLEEGANARRQQDEATGIDSWVVTEDKRPTKQATPVQIKFLDEDGNPVKIPGTETEVGILLRPNATLAVSKGMAVSPGDIVARMPQETMKSRDITGGLPRVAELFEAREPKESVMLAGASGRVSLRGMSRSKQVLVIVGEDGKEHQHLVPKGRNVLVQDGVHIRKGEEIVDGELNPHEILAMRGIEALTTHIVDEVQAVYRLQGVNINDKHIEVIVHQMLRCAVVTDAGESRYLPDDQLLASEAIEENKRLSREDKKPLKYRHILLGITKASLATDSFISAASFQETTRVLTESVVAGKHDKLRGLKENVIVGRLVPAGTGYVNYREGGNQDSSEEAAEEMMREGLAVNAEMPPSEPPEESSEDSPALSGDAATV